MIKRAAFAFLVTTAAIFSLTTPVSAHTPGLVSRTFSAYDLTQCNCLYSEGGVQAFIYSAPLVTVTSYYDGHLSATNPYTRSTDVNRFRAYNSKGTRDGLPIYTSEGQDAYILCWETDSSGRQWDKVAARVTVNDVTAMHIFKQLDQYVYEGVRYSDHHC